jgi:hypothetical protein
MSAHNLRRDYASSLLRDLRSPYANLPRQDTLTNWLQNYVSQPQLDGREPEAAQATENLLAIHAHMVAFAIPVTDRPRLN